MTEAHRDLDGPLLELIGDVCGLLDIAELGHGLLDSLHRVLPSDFISLNEIGPGDRATAIMSPESTPASLALWARFAHQNPILRYYLRTSVGSALRFSDVCSPEELHGLELYRRVYAPLGVEHQLAFTLPAGPDRIVAVALSRGGRDYSDAERDLANSARPFLIQAYLNALAFDALRTRAQEDAATPLIESLLGAGLTRRESEVMRLLALGRSNNHIAAQLGISTRTVGKHLERIFRKLGVRDRSTAAGRVWSLAGHGEERPSHLGGRGERFLTPRNAA